jgi:hypothetical protein
VLVVMTVNTEIFPVAPVLGVVVVIAVPVMDGEEVEVVKLELPTAFCTDPAMDLEGTLSIVVGSGLFRPHSADQSIQFFLGFDFSRLGLTRAERR